MENRDRYQTLFTSCIKELHSCLEYVQQYSSNKEQQLLMLSDVAKQYCEIDLEDSRAQTACEATEKYFNNQENDGTKDFLKVYNKHLNEQLADATYHNHPIWQKFNGIVQGEIAASDDPEDSESELDDENGSIDEGIIPSQFIPPVDPITKKIVQNPCRNKKCGHVYEYDTIMEHLNRMKSNKSKARCPYIGCTKVIAKASTVVKDAALKKQIQTHLNSTKVSEVSNNSSEMVL